MSAYPRTHLTDDESADTRRQIEEWTARQPYMVWSPNDSLAHPSFGPFPATGGDQGRAEAEAFARRMGDGYHASKPNFLS
jgi:hypothetical protein